MTIRSAARCETPDKNSPPRLRTSLEKEGTKKGENQDEENIVGVVLVEKKGLALEDRVENKIDVGAVGGDQVKGEAGHGFFSIEQLPAEKAQPGMGDRAHAESFRRLRTTRVMSSFWAAPPV